MEPNRQHRSVQIPEITVQGNEAPIYMDCTDVVSSIIMALAHVANRGDSAWLTDQLVDIHVLGQLELRGLSAQDTSAAAKIGELFEQIGTPVLELSAGTAIQYAKRLEDAADSVSSDIDKDTRYQFKLREARKLVDAATILDRHPSLTVSGKSNTPDPAAVVHALSSKPTMLSVGLTASKEDEDKYRKAMGGE